MKPRDYQDAAIASVFEYFQQGGTGNPLVVMPTGVGKSIIIGGFIKQAFMAYPQTRILKLTHVKELLTQNMDKLLQLWPTAPAGIFSAGLKRKEAGLPIIFGGVGSVARMELESLGKVDLVIIDEAHLVSPKDSTMYQKVIAGLQKTNPHLKVIGLTATDYRLGSGKLTEAGGLFTDVCFDMSRLDSFNWFIEQGYLVPLIPKRPAVELDVSDVHIHGGEYKQNELQAAVDKDEITYAAVKEMLAHGADRQHWLVFASGIDHAIHVAAMLDSLGVSAGVVHSKMADGQRDAAIADFKAGKFRAMVNNGILTTGFDFPGIDLIGMLRPTQSPALWVQMLGRGTRPMYAEGFDLATVEGRRSSITNSQKKDCLVLDFARNTKRLGPINDPVLPRKRGKGPAGVAPVRLCESCGTYCHASLRECPQCGVEFPRELKIKEYAGTDALIAESAIKTDALKVDRVVYAEHRKEGRPSSVQVSYFCGLRLFREWVCFEHPGFPGKKARDWWRMRSATRPPESVLEGLTRLPEVVTPTDIRVWIKPQYSEILAYSFDGGETYRSV